MNPIDTADTVAKTHGVYCADRIKAMLPQHTAIAVRILSRVRNFARAEAEKENRLSSDEYRESVAHRDPILTFLIDGVRGAGKTSLAVSLIRFFRTMEELERIGSENPSDPRLDPLKGPFDGLMVNNARRTSVHCLPMLKPDNMDTSETIMEALFAQMYLRLRKEQKQAKEDGKNEREQEAETLINQLNTGVAKGWYFSRRMGVEALMNDSLTFEDYISRRAAEASTSHDRVDIWRRYVSKYLDFFEAQMLGVVVDDMDISRHLTEDLLHSVRMFFGHPRIFSVVAANLHATRQKLLAERFSDLAPAFETLRRKDSYTASFWREFERDNLEEYLAKVFPRQHRFFISIDDRDIARLLSEPGAKDEDEKTFATFCTDQMKNALFDVVDVTARTRPPRSYHQARPPGRIEPEWQIRGPARSIENYLALWMLNNAYAEKLTPRSARHINQFAQIVAGADDDKPGEGRRVSVALFTEPLNFQVVQRLTDHDSDVHRWINAQNVDATWRGGRVLMLNHLRLTEKSLSYDYLLYRLDLELAKPAHANKDVGFPISLLPVPSASTVWAPELWDTPRNRVKMSDAVFSPPQHLIGRGGTPGAQSLVRLRQAMQGVARTMANPIIPANCLYFKDLTALPDLSWQWKKKADRRSFCRLPVRFVENCFNLDTTRVENHYFRNIVLVYASLPLLPPVPPDEFTRNKKDLLTLEQAALLNKQEEKPCWIENGATLLARLIHEASSEDTKPMKRLSPATIRLFNRKSLAEAAREQGLVKAKDGDAARLLADKVFAIAPRYKRILDSTRLAYHALRILENDFNNYTYLAFSARPPGSHDDPAIERVPFKHSRNDRTRPVTVDKLRQVLGIEETDIDERYWVPTPKDDLRPLMWKIFDRNRQGDLLIRLAAEPQDRDKDTTIRITREKSGHVQLEGTDGAPVTDPISEYLEQQLGTREAMEWLTGTRDGTIMDTTESTVGKLPQVEGHLLDTTEMDHNYRSRVMRSTLLFLWGIGPALCSLIHLEVAGMRYSRTYGKDPDQLAELMARWGETLMAAEAMTYIIARAFEVNAQRDFTLHDRIMDSDDTLEQEQFGLVFRPTPDLSVATLGLRVFQEPVEDGEKDSNPFYGIVRDTLMRLRLAKLYLEEMRAASLSTEEEREGAA